MTSATELFNLIFSACNNRSTKGCSMFTTNNEWLVNGPVSKYRITKHGMWVTIKSKAYRKGLYASDRMKFDCFVPKGFVTDEVYRNLHAKGRFEFNNDEIYFVAEEVL